MSLRMFVKRLRNFVRYRYLVATKPKQFLFEGVLVPTDSTPELRQIRNFIYRGTYERPELDAIRELLRPDDIVLEAGAGCGIISAFVASRLSDSSNLHTYEANPVLMKSIAAVAQANGLIPNVHNAALGPYAGEIQFNIHSNFSSSSLVERGGSHTKMTIPCVGVSDLLCSLQPTFLIFDIEGAETMFANLILPSGVRAISCELHPHIIGDQAVSRIIGNFISQGFVIRLDFCYGRAFSFERLPDDAAFET